MARPVENKEFVKHLHYDTDIESAILGACFTEKQAFGRISGLLTPECFYSSANQTVYSVLEEMWRKSIGVDVLTIIPYIMKKGIRDLNGEEVAYYVTRLTNAVTSTAHLELHSLMVREMYIDRELIKLSSRAHKKDGDALAKIDKLQKELAELVNIRVTDDWDSMDSVVMKLMHHMAKVKDLEFIGIPFGFTELDIMTSGLIETSLTVIAARPSVGKSALMNSMVLHQAALGKPIGIISLEMPRLQIGARMAAHISRKEFWRIFRNRFTDEKHRQELYKYLAALSEMPIYISDTVGVNVMDIKAKIAHLIYKKKVKIIYIDYLQLIEDSEPHKNFNREQQVAKISRACKTMAMEFSIPIVVFAQLNREVETNKDKKPMLHNIRESGALEQDADGVILLHRDFKSGILQDENGYSTERQAELIVAKWRNGELRTFKIGFDPPQMRFYDPVKEGQFFQDQPGGLWKPVSIGE